MSRDFDAWSEAAARVGHCANPIRLRGRSDTVDTTTGEVVRLVLLGRTRPLGVTARAVREPPRGRVPVLLADLRRGHLPPDPLRRHRRQGRPRAPSATTRWCSRPLTAPSFGLVHGQPDGGRCRPFTARPRQVCARPADGLPRPPTTRTTQRSGSRCAGTATTTSRTSCGSGGRPSCGAGSPSTLRRALAKHLGVPESRLNDHATVQYAKVAEYQRRGIIHFHALIRLDGPKTDDGFAPAPDLSADEPGRPGRGGGRLRSGSTHRRCVDADDRRAGAGLRGPGRRPAGPHHPPHRRPGPGADRRSRSPATWPSTRPSPPPTPPTSRQPAPAPAPRDHRWRWPTGRIAHRRDHRRHPA